MVINLCGVQPANLLMDSEVNLYFQKKTVKHCFFLEVQNRTKLVPELAVYSNHTILKIIFPYKCLLFGKKSL